MRLSVGFARVLDVGCGFGDSTRAIASKVGPMRKGGGRRLRRTERFDADICIGRDPREAIEFAMALGPAGEIIRLAGDEGEKRKPSVVAALSEMFVPYIRGDGVWAPSSTWFVRATKL